MQIIDNINHIVKNDLQESIRTGSKLSIAAACFSIYAYQELKKQLESIDELRFIFTSPTFVTEKFYRFSDYLFKSPQMLERLVISSISGILRFGRYPAYHGISEPHLALKSSKTVVETAAYYYAASLSIAAFAEV